MKDERKNDIVADYTGRIETSAEYDRQFPHGDPYAFQTSRHGPVIVPTDSTASYGYYVNDPNGPRRPRGAAPRQRRLANVRFSVSHNQRNPVVTIKAKKNIRASRANPREAFLSYGNEYNWNH